MYDLIDRPVKSLNLGGRLLLWAMRHWVKAAGAGRCPCGDIAAAFETYALMASLPHFHMLMAVLNREALTPLRFAAIDCARVSEHEALLVSLLRSVPRTPTETARDTMAMIVRPEAAATLLIALSALAQGMADAGLSPDLADIDPRYDRFPHE